MTLKSISRRLCRDVEQLSFGGAVAHVYNPLRYARAPHELYLERYGAGPKRVLLLGMNPGPFGMAQNGIPFGDTAIVRDWLGVEAPVKRPAHEHPKRPIEGFSIRRGEVSGGRLWGWARERYKTPERFFKHYFVWNYCPLCFLSESGRNITPDKLSAAEREPLFAACNRALRAAAELLEPRFAIGVGRFAGDRIVEALAGMDVTCGSILHPSPASPAANRGWQTAAEKGLEALGVRL